jgi:hypothetical protein
MNSEYSTFLEEQYRLQEKYGHIKSSELPDIPNDKLLIAITYWMRGKFDLGWFNECEIIVSLPKPCQNVYSTQTVTDDLLSGNFNYLFFYRRFAEQFAEMSIEGFVALGSQKLSGVVAEAVELYRQNKQIFLRYKNDDAGIEGFSALCNDVNAFDNLDKAFCEECALHRIDYAKYIRQNANCFGD